MKKSLFGRIKAYLLEVRSELKKVTWSSKRELQDSTIVVIIAIGVSAMFIGIVDLFLSRLLSLVLR